MRREIPKTNHQESIFAEDELNMRTIDSNWNQENLLSQKGIFFLKDVVKILDLDPVKIRNASENLLKRHQSPWAVLGARKIWNHWIIRMKVFAPYYKKYLVSKVRTIPNEWDGNILLSQKGTFYLVDVCKLLPFSAHQLRYQAKRNPRSRQEFGIWKDHEMKVFLVDMEKFGPFIKRLWKGRNAWE